VFDWFGIGAFFQQVELIHAGVVFSTTGKKKNTYEAKSCEFQHHTMSLP
jgi:hypothetical protein